MTLPIADRLAGAYERFVRGEPARLVAMLDAAVVYHLPGRHLGGGVLRGRTALLERLAAAGRWCDPVPRITLVRVAGAGSLVTTFERFVAERPEARIDQPAAVVWRLSPDGRVVETWSHFDDQPAVDRFWAPFVAGGGLDAELAAFFTRYAAAFDAGDLDAIARCWDVPCLFIRAGSVATARARDELDDALRSLVASHERAGYGHATAGPPSIVDQGDGLAFATVPWTVHAATGTVLWRFDVGYNLVRRDGRWTIVAATTHG